MKPGDLVKVKKGAGILSGGIYLYSNNSLSNEDLMNNIFKHNHLGVMLKVDSVETKWKQKIKVVKVYFNGITGWTIKNYIEKIK
jgi:hypothetical protein